ncbi:MAG: SRPBCC family protein [Actinobacteria bacterium]|nr:SRPBCC family protein [Actinomycetota bacterium]
MRIEGERSIEIAAAPEAVWALVADVTRMGQWSPHTVRAQWIEGPGVEEPAIAPQPADGPAVGRRFRGTNRLPIVRRWTSTATVTACEPGRRFAFAVGRDAADPTTVWSYDFEPVGGGRTRVTERWTMLREPGIVLAYYRLIGQSGRLARGVEETLRRLKAAAERAVA